MSENSISLKNVKKDVFKKYLNKSNKVNETLNITFYKDHIEGIPITSDNTFFKRWKLPYIDIVNSVEDIKIGSNVEFPVKSSIVEGKNFTDKVLSWFGDNLNIDINLNSNNDEVYEYKLFNNSLSIPFRATNCKISFKKSPKEELITDNLFVDKSYDSFELTSEELNKICSLSKLDINPELTTEYVEFYTDDENKLHIKSPSFDYILKVVDFKMDCSIKVDHKLLMLLDSEVLHVFIGEDKLGDDGDKKIIFKSKETDTESFLLPSIDIDGVSIEDFDDDTSFELSV